MSFILFVVFGFLIGLLARATMPGGQQLGAPMTIWFGIAGSLLGALLLSFVSMQRVTEFHTSGVIGSIVGAFAILGAGGVFRRTAVASTMQHEGERRTMERRESSRMTAASKRSVTVSTETA